MVCEVLVDEGGGLGMEMKARVAAVRQTGICSQNTARQPISGSRAPAMIAPHATPLVKAVLMQPKKTPRFSLLVSSVTRRNATGVTAADPMPVMTRPRTNVRKELENVMTSRPQLWRIMDPSTYARAVKI